MQEALKHLKDGKVDRIILTRPEVEAGKLSSIEKGKDTLEALMSPPLDAITKIMGHGAWKALENTNRLELQSFAFMRGKTQEGFIIADETQNTSYQQLKLLASRFGGGKLCIIGDPDQLDRKANWSVDSALTKMANFVEKEQQKEGDDDMSRWRVVRFDIDDCQRHEAAKSSLNMFKKMEEEEPSLKETENNRAAPALLSSALRSIASQ